MKVLFVGVYRDGTGISKSTIEYIKALNSVTDVVCRNVKLNNVIDQEVPGLIKELEAKPAVGCTHCIQYLLPHYMVYSGQFEKCVGLYMGENGDLVSMNWKQPLQAMDSIMVSNYMNYCQVKPINKTHLIYHPIDLEKTGKNYKPIINDDSYKFYFIGDYSKRKNIQALIRAYYLAFEHYDNVSLHLKLSNTTGEIVNNDIQNIANNINKYAKQEMYPPIHLYLARMTDQQICQFHTSCHTFVCTSFAEGWNIPMFEAMAFGKNVLCNDKFDDDNFDDKYLISAEKEPSVRVEGTFDRLHSGRSYWYVPSIEDLKNKMRMLYDNDQRENLDNLDRAYNFSYEKIGNRMLEALHA